jgi:hypothetical protein
MILHLLVLLFRARLIVILMINKPGVPVLPEKGMHFISHNLILYKNPAGLHKHVNPI